MVKPTFLGIGAQKCASSWIRNVLHDHPEVFVSHPREVDFFSYHYNRGYSWYERHFDSAGSAKAIGEISPSYFCDPLAPVWVREYQRDVKLILTLRDPIARAFSNHLHEIRMGHFRGTDLRFEAGLESNPMYLFQSRYGTHLTTWLKAFPKEQVLVLVQEEIQANAVAQARRLYSFLDVDPAYQSKFLFRRSHESVGAHRPALFRAWRAVGEFGRRHGLGNLVEGVKKFPPVAAIMAANRRDLRTEIPAMRSATRQALARGLAPELLILAELLDRHDWPWPTWHAIRAAATEHAVKSAGRG
jgi:hypothetical protein